MTNFLAALLIVSLTASGIIGGVFFIFSTTIMRSLAARPTDEAIGIMNEINAVIVRTNFMAVFLGNVILSLVVIGFSVFGNSFSGRWFAVSGAVFYLIGGFLVTIIFNVPRNNALAAAVPDDPIAANLVWQDYLREWTFWNHVRTFACIASAMFLAFSLVS